MRAIPRLEKVVKAVLRLEKLPTGEPSNIVHDLHKAILVIVKLNTENKSYSETLRKIWSALGVMDYKQADGKSMSELVTLVKSQRDKAEAEVKRLKVDLIDTNEVLFKNTNAYQSLEAERDKYKAIVESCCIGMGEDMISGASEPCPNIAEVKALREALQDIADGTEDKVYPYRVAPRDVLRDLARKALINHQ